MWKKPNPANKVCPDVYVIVMQDTRASTQLLYHFVLYIIILWYYYRGDIYFIFSHGPPPGMTFAVYLTSNNGQMNYAKYLNGEICIIIYCGNDDGGRPLLAGCPSNSDLALYSILRHHCCVAPRCFAGRRRAHVTW